VTDPQLVAVLLDKIVDRAGFADSARDSVARREELLRHMASEAAVDSGDEPGSLGHGLSLRLLFVILFWANTEYREHRLRVTTPCCYW
jgi:hypothetical protein